MRTALLKKVERRRVAQGEVLCATLNSSDILLSHVVAVDVWKSVAGEETRVASLDPSQAELTYVLPDRLAKYRLIVRVGTDATVFEESITDWI